MIVKFDSLNRMELPRFFLCNPSSTYEDGRLTDVIGGIVNTEAEENIFNFNSMSELNLRVNCPEDSAPGTESSVLEVYNAIANRRLIYIPDIGYFVITHVDETREENRKYKDISAQSLEKEIEQKEVPYIEDGTYPFLTTSVKDGLFNQLMQVIPSWTVAHVDSTVAERYRTFEDAGTDINCYSFMINDLQDAYECIFEFDSIHRQVSVYDKANYVHKTNIHISNEDIIDVLKISDDSEDLYTAITVAGDADMGIGPVNPLGTNTIYNFSHYYSWMSSGLRTKLQQWAEDVAAAKTQYGTLNESFYTELQNNSTLRLNIEAVDTQIEMYKRCRDNIVASQAGEEEANEHTVDMTELYNEAIEALGGDTIVVSIAEQISEILDDIDALIAAAEAEKATLQADLDTSTATLSSLSASISAIVNSLALTSVLSQSEYEELSKYIFEGSYTDEYITITESMTYPERLAQMTTLYDRAVSQLEMISRPKQEFTVDVESFIFEKEFAEWTAQLETGCLIDTEINENETASLFLSAITVNYDDKSMSLTFGSRYDKYDTASLFNDVLGSVSKSANSINYIKDQIYPIKVGQIDELREAIENARNLSMTNALTAQNQAFMIDGAGITGRKVNENNLSGFDDKQVKMTSNLIVFTDDAWQTCKVAIGDLGDGNYGVNAETIIGNLIIGNDLVLSGILRSANDTFVLNMETGELTMTPLWSNDIDNAVSGVESDLNSAVTNLQNQIDGAIETYSGTTAPTLSNYPASDWSADDYAAHAGDLFVGDSGSTIQGFWYRFQYNNTTGIYEWVQLRDNDIQKAIQDAADAVSTANGAASDASTAISTANSAVTTANGSVQQADVEYYKSTSATSLSGGSWQTSSPQWEEGYYIWTRTKFTPAVGSVWYSTAVCITGNTGASGANGVSITGVIEHYAINNSSATAPSSGWQTPPTDPIPMPTSSNRYLWNYETITYSSGTPTDTTKKVIAIYTEDGRGITGVTNWYLATNTSTASDLPTKGASPWTTAVQNPSSSAKYLWNYEVITYSTGNPTVTDPCIIGNYAADGNEVTVYSVVPSVYAIVKNGTTFTPTYVEFTATKTTGAGTPESASGYFVIETSTDGSTYSVPSSGVSRTSNYARYTPSGSVKFVRCKFYASNSSTAILDQETIAIITDGEKGEDGTPITITSTSVTYQAGTSGTTKPTGDWSTTVPNVSEGQYLWTKTVVTYSDGSSTESYSVSRYAINGTSPTVSSTLVEYQQSSNGTTVPTGTWQTTPPTATAGYYMWTRTTITYSDGATAVSYSVSRNGTNGQSPTAYHLIVSHAAVAKDENGDYNPTSIVLTAKSQTGTAAMANYSGRFKIETTADNNTWTARYTSSSNQATYTYSVPADIIAIRCSLYLAGGTTTLLDQQTVPIVKDGASGKDAYTVVATNESHTFAGTTNAAIADQSVECRFVVYRGTEQVNDFVVDVNNITGVPTGLTKTATGTQKVGFVTTANMTSSAGVINIPVIVDGYTFTKQFSYSIAFAGEKGDDAYTVILTNENHTFIKGVESSAVCQVIAYKGATQVACTLPSSVTCPSGMTYTRNSNGTASTPGQFTIAASTAFATTNGTLDIAITITADNKTFTRKFSYSLAANGTNGDPAVAYNIAPSVNAIINANGTLNPASVTFSGYMTTGSDAPSAYAGRFIIAESTNGTSWTNKYTSSSNESSKAYTPSASTIKFIRGSMYLAGGTTTLLDQETVAVVSDGTKGEDAYTIVLTNENHTFAGDDTKALTGQSAVCNVLVYKGTTQKSVTSLTNKTTLPTGLTFSSTTGTNASFTVGIDATNAMTTKSGTLSIEIKADGQTFNKIFSYSLALAGSNGADGENFNWNLLRNTEHFDGWTNCGSGTAGEFDNSAGTFTFPSATGWTEIRPNINIPYSAVRNQTIVLSAEVKGESGAVISVMIDPFLSATETGERAKYRNCYLNTTGSSTTGEVTVIATGEWQRVFTAPISLTDSWFSSGSGTIDYDNCYFAARVARMGTNGHTGIGIPYVVRKPKIELGEKVSAWSPARDDINGANGKDGVGIESIEELYYCSESSETPSAPTSVDDISDNVSFDADTVVTVPNTSTGGSISVAVTNNSSPVSGGEIVHFGKNLLMQIRKSTYSSYGVTVTYNEDGSMTFNGTSTGTGYPNIANAGSIYQDATPFIGKSLTFSIEGAETGIGFYMTITTAADGTYRTITNSVSARTTTFTVASGDIGFRCGLRFNSGYTFNNVTVKPMLRVASDTDTTWAPFAYETKTLSSEGTAMFNAYGGSDTFYSSGNMTSAYASVYERWVRSAPAWTTRQRYFCTCSQINFDDGTVRWTDPVGNAAYAMLSEAVDNLNNAVGGLGDVASTTQIAELQSQLESLRDTGLFNQFIVDNDGVHITFGTGQDSGEIFMDGANVKFLINNELKAYINADGFNFDYGILTTALTIGKADSTGGTWTWMKAASGHFRLVYRG